MCALVDRERAPTGPADVQSVTAVRSRARGHTPTSVSMPPHELTNGLCLPLFKAAWFLPWLRPRLRNGPIPTTLSPGTGSSKRLHSLG